MAISLESSEARSSSPRPPSASAPSELSFIRSSIAPIDDASACDVAVTALRPALSVSVAHPL
eukprot:822235-Prymnesium_polylepis.1